MKALALLLAGGALSAPLPRPAAQSVAADGFELQALAYPGQAFTATLASGDVVSWDGVEVLLSAPDGALRQVLATFPSSVFASFVVVAPDESFAVIGESSVGDLYKVDLSAGGAAFLTHLFFNFDAAFDPAGDLVVSAATGGFSTGNDLVRVDPASGAQTPLAHVAGPSGPVALDPAGNLYYATQSPVFPAPPGSTDVLLFAAPLLDGSSVLSEADALLIGMGFDGGASLAFDPEGPALYMAESSFGAGTSRIVRVNGLPAASPVLLAGTGGLWYSNLEVQTAPGGPVLAAYQPAGGGTLRVNATDFAATSQRSALRPRRPSLALQGPGLGGAGPFQVVFGGGVPLGQGMLAFAFDAFALAREVPFSLGGAPPLFLGLDLGHAFLVPVTYGLDAGGAGTASFTNPGGLEGVLALQGLVLDPFPRGTTPVALN